MNAFRAAVEARDLDAMRATLHPEVTFNSPAVFRPYEGIEAVTELLGHVLHVLEDFHYIDELDGDGTHALVFAARVGDKQVQGLDHLVFAEDGSIAELTVMIRPLSGLIATAQAMGARMEAAA